MALSTFLQYFSSFIPGSRLVDGGDCLTMAQTLFGPRTGITATAGGAAATGTRLSVGPNRVDTCATNGDSVRLPPAIPGSMVMIWNNTGQTLGVFGLQANQGGGLAAGDQVCLSSSNIPAAVATGVTLATVKVAVFYCFSTGVWKQFLTA